MTVINLDIAKAAASLRDIADRIERGQCGGFAIGFLVEGDKVRAAYHGNGLQLVGVVELVKDELLKAVRG